MTHTPFLLKGESEKQAKQWQSEHGDFMEQVIAFGEKYGCIPRTTILPFLCGECVIDVTFEAMPDAKVWKQVNGESYVYIPNPTSREGRAIEAEVSEITLKCLDWFLGCQRDIQVGRYYLTSKLQQLKDGRFLVGIPNLEDGGAFYVPRDAQELKMSEFYKLIEDVGVMEGGE